jgi:RNA polymerase sigma factor (sigma-70 family)
MNFTHVYETFANSVYAFLKLRLRDPFLIEDIFQETFLAVYRQMAELDDIRHPKAWILTIAHRKMVDHLRKTSREISDDPLAGAAERSEDPDYSDLFAGEMLGLLDPVSRMIVYGIYIEGLTCKEMADVLGIPEGTVKSRCYHARAKLKERLGREWRV